jgi:hypothetical protein
VTLLARVPGILALVVYVYLTTPPSAVPAGLTLLLLAVVSGINPLLLLAVVSGINPLLLLAVVSGINPLLLLGVACLVGAYAAPRAGLRS